MSSQERAVIIFLLATAIAGLGVSFYKRSHPPDIKIISSDEITTSKGGAVSRRAININTAAKEELVSLPGIGPALADEIIAYRQENGYFYLAEEIVNVPGIGEARYQRLKDSIVTEDE